MKTNFTLSILLLCCFFYRINAQSATSSNVLFVLDASGSMWQKLDGEFKIATAKTVLQKLVDGLPADTRAGLIAYGHNRKSDCKDIETLLSINTLDKKAFAEKLNALNPQGMTPIAKSLEHALALIEKETNPITCILVSDGLETCEGNACELVRQAKMKGVKITVHVIGFGLAEKDLSALECIAQAGGGQYLPANNAGELSRALEKTVEQPPVGGGYLSVKTTLEGKPVDALVKVFKKGETKETTFGRTYNKPETNPRVMLLPAGTYELYVEAITLNGNPKQTYKDLIVKGNDTLFQTVDFSQGMVEILVTRNDALSDAVVALYKAGTRELVTQTRSYNNTSANPVKFKVLPGIYDVEIKTVEISGSSVFRIENQQLSAIPLSLKHNFTSGELNVGARKGGDLTDVVLTVYSKTSGKEVARGRTYTAATSNPKSFTLEPGQYRVEATPVNAKDLQKKTMEVEVKIGETVTRTAEW
ncbi:MAG: VWA domain-containing protein [Lewinellaceae bacterium]|nr:VWA domain-containing protein [Lewinellaceae bacterium]